jgi:hypothetical protein
MNAGDVSLRNLTVGREINKFCTPVGLTTTMQADMKPVALLTCG